MQKAAIKREKLRKAFTALEAIYLNPVLEDRVNIDATIQRFEFTFALCWKFLKDYFQERGLVLNYPKEIL
jgi:nucleotidyltransferase substrate binding protein (TIGR01987 family)